MSGRPVDPLDVFAPPTLRERLTAYVSALRDRAATANQRGALVSASLATTIAGEIEAILDETGPHGPAAPETTPWIAPGCTNDAARGVEDG